MTIHASTIMPVVMACLRPGGKISAIYAYAPAPFSPQRIRVQVVWAGPVGSPPRLVASVRPCAASPYTPTYRVRVDQLTSISVFVTWEM